MIGMQGIEEGSVIYDPIARAEHFGEGPTPELVEDMLHRGLHHVLRSALTDMSELPLLYQANGKPLSPACLEFIGSLM